MEEYSSILFTQLNNSNEFQTLISDFCKLKINIEGILNINQLFEMLKHNSIAWSLRGPVERILDEYVKGLLDGMDLNNFSLFPSYYAYSIKMAFNKIPIFEFKPNYWGGLPSNLVYIDFSKQQITVYDSKNDYKKAEELLQRKIEKEGKKLQDLKKHLILMKKKKKSRIFILKEIRNNIWFLSEPKHAFFYISCYIFPSKYKILLNIMDDMIEKQKEKVENQKKRIQKFEEKNYLNIYEELCNLQQQILKRLEPLCFKIITETAESVFSKNNSN